MFDIFAHLLSSIASFLFPIFASYKALKTSDPAQLTPWLMYWVVFGCGLLVESWVDWITFLIPFYSYIRLLFILYLVLPQTQGARFLYETHVHPFLEQNETQIEKFIADAHERLKATGIQYLKQAIEAIKVNVLGFPPSAPEPEHPPASAAPQGYTQSLLARFSVPAARWTAGANSANGSGGGDFFSLLAGAVSAAAAAGSGTRDASASGSSGAGGFSALIPSNLTGTTEKMSFIAAQRERLNVVLGALDREAQALQREETLRSQNAESYPRAASWTLDGAGSSSSHLGEEPTQRPSSRRPSSTGFGFGDWNRNRSESEFEKIDAESGAEDETGARRRAAPGGGPAPPGSSWMPWGWGGATPTEHDRGTSSGRDL